MVTPRKSSTLMYRCNENLQSKLQDNLGLADFSLKPTHSIFSTTPWLTASAYTWLWYINHWHLPWFTGHSICHHLHCYLTFGFPLTLHSDPQTMILNLDSQILFGNCQPLLPFIQLCRVNRNVQPTVYKCCRKVTQSLWLSWPPNANCRAGKSQKIEWQSTH